MRKKIAIVTALAGLLVVIGMVALISNSFAHKVSVKPEFVAQFTESGEMILPQNSMWRECVYVGSPLTPNALNDSKTGFPNIATYTSTRERMKCTRERINFPRERSCSRNYSSLWALPVMSMAHKRNLREEGTSRALTTAPM